MDLREKFTRIESELNGEYLEREDVIRVALITLIAGENCALIGPPGVGKTSVLDALTRRLEYPGNRGLFQTILGETSTPEMVVGPISVAGLQQDRYVRKSDGYLPTSVVGFLDEVFRAPGPTLGVLLPILNERRVSVEGRWEPVATEAVFMAANSIPQEESLMAMWDRVTLRLIVKGVRSHDSLAKILGTAWREGGDRMSTNAAKSPTTITLDELHAARTEATKVDASDLVPTMLRIHEDLKTQGLEFSERRLKWAGPIVKVEAYLNGHAVADGEDMMVLEHVLWNTPEDQPIIRRAISHVVAPLLDRAIQLRDAARDEFENAMGTPDDATNLAQVIMQTTTNMNTAKNRLRELAAQARGEGMPSSRIEALQAEVEGYAERLMERMLGLTRRARQAQETPQA